jgi:hypothetical protein
MLILVSEIIELDNGCSSYLPKLEVRKEEKNY